MLHSRQLGVFMELIRTWRQTDKNEFLEYIQQLSKGQKAIDFTTKIVNTKNQCLAISCVDINNIVRSISKGDFLSYLDLKWVDNHELTIIYAQLLGKIKDFDLFKSYLDWYVTTIDNWASCDQIRFPINNKNRKQFFQLAQIYNKSRHTFIRRVGIIILMKILSIDNIHDIIKICDEFFDEKEYYVNMAISWLLCECFIKYRDITLNYFLGHNRLNKFVINKTISKCCDSFRVKNEDKQLLKSLRKK